jgi:hypothetical protein
MSKQDIDFKIGADLKQFRSAMGNIDHSLKRLSGGFGALGGVIGASFAVDAIRQFVTESVELANQAEGVKVAFDRLNDPQLLSKLQTATAGTVDDLKLMQTAVKAKNFRIPMDVLAKGLEFAQRRAQETGESVDYMVDSFVTGLGRKSVMILDNLGISASELKEKMAAGGTMADAVGEIMEESFAESGERVESTSMKIDAQRAAITNLKMAVGEQLQPVYSSFLEGTIGLLDSLNTMMSEHVTSSESLATFASFFQGAQGKAFRMYINAQKEGRKAAEEFDAAQKNSQLTVEDFRKAQEEYEADRRRKQAEELEILKAYEDKLGDVQLKIRAAHHDLEKLFKPGDFDEIGFAELPTLSTDIDNIADGLSDIGREMQYLQKLGDDPLAIQEMLELGEIATESFDHSIRESLGVLQQFADEVMIIGGVLKRSFEAAFVPIDELEEGETRLMRFREVFVQQMTQMAAALLATAAAAAILAVILTAVFGGSNVAGAKLFGKSGMKFGDLFQGIFGGIGGMSGFGFNNSLGGNQQGGGIQIFGRLSGSDILISSEKANRERSRYTFG